MNRLPRSVSATEPTELLATFLDEESDRIVRLWAKRLRAELQEVELPGRDLRAPLEQQVTELARLLHTRGEEAVRLWPETVRPRGAARYAQRFDADDLAREYKILHRLLVRLYARRRGELPVEIAELLAELMGEACAAVEASYTRLMRTEEVRFKDAAVMESILQNVDVGIVLGELDGTLSYATPAVARLLGVPVRSLLGGRGAHPLALVLSQVNARHPDGSSFHAADLPFARVLKEHRAVRGITLLITRPSGDEVVLELSGIPIWEESAGSQMMGVLQTLTDRTESKHKTRELSNAHEELRRLQGRLFQRSRTQALGQLASGAAHALNNFLNVIRLRVTLLRREFKPDHLDALDRTVKNIGELVARLQEFSVQPGQEQLADVPFDEVLQEALELVRPELAQTDPPIQLQAELGAAGVRADRGLLRELLTNLLLAVTDRLPKGGRVTLRTRREEGMTHFTLQDDGPAYSDDQLARLFDPLKGAARQPQLSLLLAMARTQVQRWGGELGCERVSRDTGAVFHLRLPTAERPDERPAPSPPRHTLRRMGQARRVLVVDDDLDNARMMAEVLGEEGYDVKVAHAGDAALQLWEQHRFDAALLDALMPDMSGWELARRLRERAPHVRLAMVTGADVRGQNRNNLALVDAVFRKPIDVGALDDFLSNPEEVAQSGEERPPPLLHS